MGDDLQTAVAAIAGVSSLASFCTHPSLTISIISNPVAIAIPLIIAGMVRACGVSPHRPFQTMVPRDRRRLNATVHLVPLSGTLHLMAVVTFACLSILTILACDRSFCPTSEPWVGGCSSSQASSPPPPTPSALGRLSP